MRLFVFSFFLLSLPSYVAAGDWPMWRYDAQRSASSPDKLPGVLYHHWTREYPPEIPAWPEQEKMQFDICYEPIVAGQMLYVNSARHDCIRAIHTRTGERAWTFYAEGPIRFAPVAWQDNLYFTSDDGYLYCIAAKTGTLNWKVRGGPSDRKILGNERLVSTWPARGAPVLADGTVYFAASIWPFMGIFVHAVDAQTGKIVWTNDGDGSLYMKQPHSSDSFASIAPQGPLVVSGETLIVPGGRSVPAVLDRRSGKLLRYQLNDNNRKGGGTDVAAMGKVFFNGGAVFEVATEKYQGEFAKQLALSWPHAFAYVNGMCRAYDARIMEKEEDTNKADDKDAKSAKSSSKKWPAKEWASVKTLPMDTLIRAGDRLYGGGDGHIVAIDILAKKKALELAWIAPVKGKVVRLIAGDDRLFAATREGALHCFGPENKEPVFHVRQKPSPEPKDEWITRTRNLLDVAGVREGYGIVIGLGNGRLVAELLKQTKLDLLVLESDAAKVLEARRKFTISDHYGVRLSIHHGDLKSFVFPPYLASLIVSEDTTDIPESAWPALFQSLRPFGGTICVQNRSGTTDLAKMVHESPELFVNGEAKLQDGWQIVRREGALPGSANWTHEHADASNTRVSKDRIVKAPLGILWFGGPSHENILPRHGHGPQPQVVDGRLFIEGMDMIRALDIYTGRLLWEAKLPGVGRFYNNTAHQPGANSSGGNFVSMPDGIYVAYNNTCVKLDPANGKKLETFLLPELEGKKAPTWGYINVADDFIVGGAEPILDPKALPPKEPKASVDADQPKSKSLEKVLKLVKGPSDNLSGSKHLVVMNRHDGSVLWKVEAKHWFRHNATCIGGGRLYTIDRLSGEQLSKLKAKEIEPAPARLLVYELKTGKLLWSTDTDVFGTWLSYSTKHDVVVEAGRVTRDSLRDEPKGMRAYAAADGRVLWFEKNHVGPAIIHNDTILQDQGACDLLTGKVKMRLDPITGVEVPWKWTRNYGCNTPAASENLLTFRSGAAGYFDLCGDGGTGNFGGFRSSCTNNLIVAGGILTVPEYTRTCTCSYQNQTSIALIHMPDAEMWTFFGSKEVKGAVKRLGLNFGAVGDRRAEDGTLWMEMPSVGGVSPVVNVTMKPTHVDLYRRHSASFGGPFNWVAASGVKGAEEITVHLGKTPGPRRFRVKLFFAEPDDIGPGQRVFHVFVQGEPAFKNVDIVQETRGPRQTLIKELRQVEVGETLNIRLEAVLPEPKHVPLLCGIEVIQETN
jgi:outer membrane protein assembly factor BamB